MVTRKQRQIKLEQDIQIRYLLKPGKGFFFLLQKEKDEDIKEFCSQMFGIEEK